MSVTTIAACHPGTCGADHACPPSPCAQATSHHISGPVARISHSATSAPTPDIAPIAPTRAATVPSNAITPTTGATSRFAGSDTRLTRSEIAITSGVVRICAAIVIANSTATGSGTRRTIHHCRSGAAHSTSPSVATTDSAKPGPTAICGQNSSTTTTAAPSAGSACARRAANAPSRPTPPITAARSTLSVGRTRITKPNMVARPTATVSRVDAPASRTASTTAPHTREKLAPETAVKWVRPAAEKSVRNC